MFVQEKTRYSCNNSKVHLVINRRLFSGHYSIDSVRSYEDPRVIGPPCNQRLGRTRQDQADRSTLCPDGVHTSHRTRGRYLNTLNLDCLHHSIRSKE